MIVNNAHQATLRRAGDTWVYYVCYAAGLLLILPFALPCALIPRSWRRRRFVDVNPKSAFSEAHAELSNALAYVFR